MDIVFNITSKRIVIDLDVSIIVVNYNTRDITDRCLESIYKHASLERFEVIVVDNDSSDGSQDLIRSKYPQVKLIANKKNVGFGRANNQGADIAQGKYILLLNSDTVVSEDGFLHLYRFMESHADAGIAGGKILSPRNTVEYSCRRFPHMLYDMLNLTYGMIKSINPFKRKIEMMDFDHNTIKKVDWVSGAYMMVRKKVIEKTALFDPDIFMYYEDTELCKRASKLGFNTYYFPRSAIYHFHGQSTKKNLARGIVYSFYGSVIYYSKHHNRLLTSLYANLIITSWYLLKYVLALLCAVVPSVKLVEKKRLLTDCIAEYKTYNARNI